MTGSLTGTRRTVLVALFSVSTLLFAGQASAVTQAPADAAGAPSDDITAEVVTVNGSGCPAGTVKVFVAPDKQSFRIRYADYVAADGAKADPTDVRKNCQINLLVSIPSGFTFAIAQAEYRGYANIHAGATAQQHAYYYWAGSSDTRVSVKSLTGPYFGSWNNIDVTPVAELVYAPCGVKRNLNINTDLRVNQASANPNTTSWISMASTSGSVDTIYHIDWKTC